ncbi:MAG: hypothetical protein KGL39_50455 [Patescibacteria group bacterium]|nr:hypothetical protein [Patescibacteria group bacterium]
MDDTGKPRGHVATYAAADSVIQDGVVIKDRNGLTPRSLGKTPEPQTTDFCNVCGSGAVKYAERSVGTLLAGWNTPLAKPRTDEVTLAVNFFLCRREKTMFRKAVA